MVTILVWLAAAVFAVVVSQLLATALTTREPGPLARAFADPGTARAFVLAALIVAVAVSTIINSRDRVRE
jgi:hypothetical protein